MNPLTLLQGSQMPALCLMSGALGSIIGSFLGVVAERIPPLVKEEEGRVICCFRPPTVLSVLIASPGGRTFLFSAGAPCVVAAAAVTQRYRRGCYSLNCRARSFALTAAFAPSLAGLLALWVLWCGLLPLATIDAKHMLLPDCLTQPLLWAGLLYHALSHTLPLTDALYGAAAGYLSLWLIYWAFRLTTGREGLGYGDFKLLAALGAWCGWQALPSLLLAAALSGIALYFLL